MRAVEKKSKLKLREEKTTEPDIRDLWDTAKSLMIIQLESQMERRDNMQKIQLKR